jgi:hypothetical protein
MTAGEGKPLYNSPVFAEILEVFRREQSNTSYLALRTVKLSPAVASPP